MTFSRSCSQSIGDQNKMLLASMHCGPKQDGSCAQCIADQNKMLQASMHCGPKQDGSCAQCIADQNKMVLSMDPAPNSLWIRHHVPYLALKQ